MSTTLFDDFIQEKVEADCKDAIEDVKDVYAAALETRLKNIIDEELDRFCQQRDICRRCPVGKYNCDCKEY